ncbi:MAG: TIGR03936 family radical SAM-associated protein [Planctomycetota bacterium]|nr:TIGR03936 family radical SAM-associated protein [Planctomycetota bacterium]
MNSPDSQNPDPTPSEQVGSLVEGLRETAGVGESHGQVEAQPLRIRYRIRFSKSGLLRWISHRDLARLWERMLRRANFRLSMTQGFHPKPRIGFPSALALGVDGEEEVVELEFAEDLPPTEVLRRLEADQQPGLGITSVSKVPNGFKKPQLESSQYSITVPDSFPTEPIQPAIETLLERDTVSVVRKKKVLDFNTNTNILSLKFRDGNLQLVLAASEAATLRPHDVLDVLGFSDWVEQGSLITRTRVHLQQDIKSDDPSVIAIAGAK